MKIANDIQIFIVEDLQNQSDLLKDKLLEFNSDYNIIQFTCGSQLLNYFQNGYRKNKYNYIIIDYDLHTKDDSEELDGFDIIKVLGERHPKIKIIVFSAYIGDEDTKIDILKDEHNVIDFVKKSEHAYSRIQNIFRFDYAQNSLLKKKRRFQWSLVVFVALLIISFVYFAYTHL